MYPFTYEIEHFDDFDEVMKTHCGLLYAENYTDAITQISHYYGENNIEEVAIHGYADGPIEVDKEVLDLLIKSRKNNF